LWGRLAAGIAQSREGFVVDHVIKRQVVRGMRLVHAHTSDLMILVVKHRDLARAAAIVQASFVTFIAAQKSGLSARGTAASCPEYHMMFSAQTASVQSPRPRP
jgi:hypothetical protein